MNDDIIPGRMIVQLSQNTSTTGKGATP